ncbi:uncharacterized protein LOC134291708 [Aedes albopictus]|uniref:Reverse transcriptase domain-containing protein n=1 Tax=Aedes albopictus TaxID=7160 RepID=A0ABM1Z010_AEDAL
MEALKPPTAVEPFQPAFCSRPGPACGSGVRGFQMNVPGKYDKVTFSMSSDPFIASSQLVSVPPSPLMKSTLGRTDVGFMEALKPPTAVELFQPAFCSRPGPACGSGGRVFQLEIEGKFNSCNQSAVPDPCIASSSLTTAPVTLAQASQDGDDDIDIAPTIEPVPQMVNNSDEQSIGVSIYYQNVRGLRTKIEDFYTAVTASLYDVIVLTETWLDEVIPSCMLFNNDYMVYRGDRTPLTSTKTRSGGTLIAVKCTIPSNLIPVDEVGFEHVWVSLRTNRCNLAIGAVYIPPDKASDAQLINRHISCMESVMSSSKHDAAAVFGDYNRPGIRWIRHVDHTCSVDVACSSLTQSNVTLLDGMSSNNMWQLNDLKNQYGNVLDLLFVSEELVNVSTIEEVDDPLVSIDPNHKPFLFCVENCGPTMDAFEDDFDFNALDFRKADFSGLSEHLTLVNWSIVTSCTTLDEAVEKFTDILQNAFAMFVPQRRPPKKPAWSNAELRLLKRKCNAANRVYQSGLPSSMYLDHQRANSLPEKCELFASFFSSVFANNRGSADAALELTPADCVDVTTFVVSPESLRKAVKKLKSSYQPGPDGIAACILKKCSQQLLEPLAYLFNFSLRASTFPTRWKASFMFPVHKKDSKNDVRCYRGITSLCACSKLFEIIVSEHLFSRTKNYISMSQHGFFPGRSVSTNLCEFTSFCLRNIDQGRQIDAVYTDLKAAFDKVDHDILLKKLGKLGFSSNLVEWLRSYLCGRKLAVKIGSSISRWFVSSSGVPQGSNLGPLLFSLFINDAILHLGDGFCLAYADDLKLFILVNSIDDCRKLQTVLDKFAAWCSANKMQLSIPKCFVVSFHRKMSHVPFDYTIDGELLNRTESIRDLGVTLDSALSFRNHHEEVIDRARRQLGFVSKLCKEFRDPYTLKSLYVSLVRPILETSSIVWDPYHSTVASRIESVQKRFIRFALRNLPWNDPLNLPPYGSRCELIGLETLKQRRKRAKAMFVAKLLSAEIDAPNLLQMINFNVPGYALRRPEFLRLPFRRRDYASQEPVRSMMECFNEVVHLFDFNITTKRFKAILTRVMFN